MTDPAAPPAGRHLHVVTDRANDPALERLLLGQCLWSHRAIEEATAAGVTGATFYDPGHEITWWALKTLHALGAPVNAATVTAELERRKALTTSDMRRTLRGQSPAAWLAALATNVPTDGNADWTAQQLLNLQAQRDRQKLAERLHHLADNGETDLYDQELRQHLEATPATDTQANTWQPVNLNEIRNSDHPRPTATLLTNTAGQGILYPGAVHSVSGEPTSGKSWLALAAVAQEIALGHPVGYIDFEDRAETLVARLDDMGANPAHVDQLVRYIRPEQALTPASAALLDDIVAGCRVVIVDGVTEAMTMHGLDLSKNPDVATWLEMLPRRIASRGPAVLQIDHVVKDAESRGRYAIGGQHKLAGIVASYSMVVAKPFAPGKGGHARVVVQKDRHGDVGTVGMTAVELHMEPDLERSDTAVTWTLTPAQHHQGDDATGTSGPRYTGYMEKLSRIIEAAPGMNQGDVIRACKGNKDTFKLAALNTLVNEGFMRFEKRGNAKCYYSLAPFREDEE